LSRAEWWLENLVNSVSIVTDWKATGMVDEIDDCIIDITTNRPPRDNGLKTKVYFNFKKIV